MENYKEKGNVSFDKTQQELVLPNKIGILDSMPELYLEDENDAPENKNKKKRGKDKEKAAD